MERSSPFAALFYTCFLGRRFPPLLLLFFMMPLSCAPSIDLEASRLFQQAEQRFSSAQSTDDYLEAARLYERLLEEGNVCGAVLYNLGNAYMQADQKGLAIAAYRRAQRYRPRDPLLDANLRFALGALAGAEREQGKTLWHHILFWKDWVSYPEKCRLTLAAAAMALFMSLLALFTGRGGARKTWRRLRTAALVVTALSALSAGHDYYRYEYLDHGVVTASEVVARKGNAETWEPAFTQPLVEGTEFRILEDRGDWVRISLSEGQEGWIREDDQVRY